MSKFKIILSMAITLFCFTAVNAQAKKSTTKIATADSTVYKCPMKCEGDKTYSKAGKCPVCNMSLKAISKPVAAVYKCPMKCEGDKTYSKTGKCPKCNMDLAKIETRKEAHGHEGHNHK